MEDHVRIIHELVEIKMIQFEIELETTIPFSPYFYQTTKAYGYNFPYRCFSIVFRLYNQSGSGRPDLAIEPRFREKLEKLCPCGGNKEVTGNLDVTPQIFDNQYYKELVRGRGFLNSDQTLHTFVETREYVKMFWRSKEEFFRAFIEGMVKLGDLHSGLLGEVRKNCRVANRQDI